jgi:hypothetical protein
VMVALTTSPPRTTWFHPLSRSICSVEGSIRREF